MKSIFDVIKSTVSKAFHFDKAEKEIEQERPSNFENFNKGPVNPGLEEKEEDVGKKVFERTGHIREGVGQSSTLQPQEKPAKTNQGIKNHTAKKKNNYKGRKPKDLK